MTSRLDVSFIGWITSNQECFGFDLKQSHEEAKQTLLTTYEPRKMEECSVPKQNPASSKPRKLWYFPIVDKPLYLPSLPHSPTYLQKETRISSTALQISRKLRSTMPMRFGFGFGFGFYSLRHFGGTVKRKQKNVP